MENTEHLEEYLKTCRHNVNAPIAALPNFVRLADQLVRSACTSLSNPNYLEPAKLMLSAHSSMRGALLLSIAGATVAANAVYRQSIEASAHAYLLRFDDGFREAWLSNEPSSKQKTILRQWKSKFREHLETKDPKLWILFEGNYADWIALGAHPSSMSVENSMDYVAGETTGWGTMQHVMLTGKVERNHSFLYFLNASVIFSEIYSSVWPERARLLRFHDQLSEIMNYHDSWINTAKL